MNGGGEGMPRKLWTRWALLVVGLGWTTARAQDDLAPPPKPAIKKPAPLDELSDPPAPKTKAVAPATKTDKGTIDLPGVELPDDPPLPAVKPEKQPKAEAPS